MYVVTENRPGCLPETEPVFMPTYQDAKSLALDTVLELVELRRAFDKEAVVIPEGDSWTVASNDPYDVGRVVEVSWHEGASWNDGDDEPDLV